MAVRLFYTNSDFARVAEVRVSGGDLCIRKYAEAQPSRQVRTSTPTRLVYHYRFALNSILIGRAMHAPTGLYRFVILSVSEESRTEQSNLIFGRARACSRRKVLSDFGGAPRCGSPVETSKRSLEAPTEPAGENVDPYTVGVSLSVCTEFNLNRTRNARPYGIVQTCHSERQRRISHGTN